MAITITITEKGVATGLTASLVAGGSLVVGTTYYYKMVAVEYTGNTLNNYLATVYSALSSEVSFIPTSGNQSIKLDWVAPSKITGVNFNGYLILRTTTSGDYSSATAKLIGPISGSNAATTTADAVSFTDTGERSLYRWATYTLGIPKVAVDTTGSSVVTEEVLYQGFVTAGKTQFATKTANQRNLGVQYYFTGFFNIGVATGCNLTFQGGREIIIDGNFNCHPGPLTVINMGSEVAGAGATLGLLGHTNDQTMSLRGNLNLYNSKIYEVSQSLGVFGTTGEGYYYGTAFKGLSAYAPSVVKDCQILTYNGNSNLSGQLSVINTVLEINPRCEAVSGLIPELTDVTIRGNRIYTYAGQYFSCKRVTMPYATVSELYFHGVATRRYVDLIDFTPTNIPLKALTSENPSLGWYQRKWSLNVKAVNAANDPLQNVAVGALDKNGVTSVFVNSGTKTNNTFLAQAATSLTVLDGTKVAVNDVIRIAAELMLVTAKATNTLTVTRGYAGSFANDYNMQHSFIVWVQKDTALSNSLGVVEEQYLLAETHQGNAANASPYQYDTVSYTPHTITISKYGYLRVTLTQSVAAPVKLVQRMLVDAHITANEATAGAYTGIDINQPSATITITVAHTINELYDYVQWWASRDTNLRYATPLTTTDGVTYTLDYDLVIDGCMLSGSGTIAMPTNDLTLPNSGSSTLTIAHSGGALTSIGITGYSVGARLQVFDTVDSVELYNGIPAGTTLTLIKNWSGDHLLRIRMARVVGVDADALIQTFAVFSQGGAQVLLTPVPDTVYEANGIDGDTVTEFTADFPNVQIDVSDPDGETTPQRGYAWYMSGQMTAPGIAAFHGGMSADDAVNYRINVGVLDMRIQNVSALPCVIAGARIYRDDGSSIFAAGVGPIQAEPSKAYIASGTSAATVAAAVRSELSVELARVDVSVSSRLPAASYIPPDNAGIAAIPTTPDARLDNLDVAISSRLAAAAYTAPSAGVTPSDVWSHATRTITAGGLTVAEIEASTVLAKEATVATRLASATYIAPLDATQTQAASAAALLAYAPATGADAAAIQGAVSALPAASAVRAEIELSTVLAKEATVSILPSAATIAEAVMDKVV